MGKYDDIIDKPHHVSKKHPHMSNYDRAAQFSPFAALTGHDAAVKETARLTERRIELDESEKQLIDEKLQYLTGLQQPEAEITYFQPDVMKDGGSYPVKRGGIKKFDLYRHVVVMEDSSEIRIDDIVAVKIF